MISLGRLIMFDNRVLYHRGWIFLENMNITQLEKDLKSISMLRYLRRVTRIMAIVITQSTWVIYTKTLNMLIQ